MPSMLISPVVVSYKRHNKDATVDFPEPVFPIIASVCPGETVKLMCFGALIQVSGYVNETLLNSIAPVMGVVNSLPFNKVFFSCKN